jgi:hypothetical protein
MFFKNWNWKRIVLNTFIIFFGLLYINELRYEIAKSIVFCGMVIALVLFNKE